MRGNACSTISPSAAMPSRASRRGSTASSGVPSHAPWSRSWKAIAAAPVERDAGGGQRGEARQRQAQAERRDRRRCSRPGACARARSRLRGSPAASAATAVEPVARGGEACGHRGMVARHAAARSRCSVAGCSDGDARDVLRQPHVPTRGRPRGSRSRARRPHTTCGALPCMAAKAACAAARDASSSGCAYSNSSMTVRPDRVRTADSA